MKILCLGDVVSKLGRETLQKVLPNLKAENNIDFCVCNGENSADGNGILKQTADLLFSSGVDVITGGNHTFRRKEFYEYLEQNEFCLRPQNYGENAPGNGMCVFDMGRVKIAVINIMGVVFLEPLDNPFLTLDRCIDEAEKQGCKIILVDFHAEATAEKKSFGYYANGRVSAVFGTHTHTQTNDLQIFSDGTGYITDLGMCGAKHSVLGIKPELAIQKQKEHLPVRFENAEGECLINGVIFEIDETTGKCIDTKLINLTV